MKIIRHTGNSVLFLIAACLILGSCANDKSNQKEDAAVSADLVTNPVTASGKKAKSELPLMEFVSEEHDFGLIVQGETVSHTFKFKNVGGADLIISSVSATCGCTATKWSREPIKPGGEGSIEVVFNSSGRSGTNHKEVKVLCNGQPNTIKLGIRAEIYVPSK